MSWRVVVISNRAKLDYKMDYLVVRNENTTSRIHLDEISLLMLESTAVSITSYLLCELVKRKINIIFCDEKRLPLASVAPFYGSHDTSLKYRTQITWDAETKKFIWAEIVRAKIRGQYFVLDKFDKEQKHLLELYLTQIEPGDATNREGHAAKVYFNALFGNEFSRSLDTPQNAALNYGYSIFLSTVAREIVACGYCTQLGLFHDNMFNQYNLASDLMEPFRPFVDITAINTDLSVFEHEQKMEFVKILNKEIRIDGKMHFMTNAVKIYVKSVFDAICERNISIIKFPEYEL